MISVKNKFKNKKVYNQFKNNINSSNIANVKNNPNLEIKSFLELYDENINEYFDRLDNYDGFFSTQQIESINFENFEEHVFFDSAIEKTNYAFKKIFNDFPYDGSEREVTNYLSGLDGYTRFILKNKHLKNLGYLKFDGDHYIKVVDRNGWLLNDFKKKIKIGLLNLTNNFNFSFDFWLYPFTPEVSNTSNQQIIFQKVSNNSGFSVFLDSFSNNSCNLNFFISKGNSEYKCSTSISINNWSHINISLNSVLVDDSNILRCQYYINSIPKNAVHSNTGWGLTFEEAFNDVNVTIGGGTNHSSEISSIKKTYYGLMDEFRVYAGEVRDREIIALEKDENVFSKESLKLYFRFNEPSGEYINNNIVLDHSGNKLHGLIYHSDNYDQIDQSKIASLRSKYLDVNTPLIYELLENNPVLFPKYNPAIDVQNIIIEEAKNYDLNNPNSFWKLLPKNLFIEGSDFDNIDETYINTTKFTAKDALTGIRTAPNQKMINLLSIWARFFDEFKLYIDSITSIIDMNYDNLNNDKLVDGVLLPLALKLSGFNFREILPYPILEKLKNKNLTPEEKISSLSLRQIQNKLWQRLLINSKDILTSKGTASSIHSVFNSFGLESSKFISIKEFNGQNKFNINNDFYSKKINFKEIDFSCDEELFNEATANNRILFKSPAYNSNLVNNPLDISNEWSVECLYSYKSDKTEIYPLKQSLLRLDNNTRSDPAAGFKNPHINIVFERDNKKNKYGKIKIFINEVGGDIKIGEIDKVNLLSGELFYLNLQRKKNKNINDDLTYYEYILTVSSVSENFYSKKVQQVKIETKTDIFDKSTRQNIFSIGFYDAYDSSTNSDGTNNIDFISDMSYETKFEGSISNFRIYKKSMSDQEIFLKCKTISTVALDDGIESAILNIDLFEKLSNIKFNGSVYEIKSLLDLSHSKSNNFNRATLSRGSSLTTYFPFKTRKIQGLIQNSEIDFPKSNNFIYINSFESEKFKKQYGNDNVTNINQVRPDYLYSSDTRLSIDFSSVNFLNQDISKIININKTFTEKLSQSSNLFTDSYVDLNNLRNKYFERLEREININDLYQIYKYFDNILEELLYECIPSKVKYKGFNFVYESHALERHKYQYKMINSNIPVFDETLKYSYHRDLSNSIDHRKTENKNSSFVVRNKVSR